MKTGIRIPHISKKNYQEDLLYEKPDISDLNRTSLNFELFTRYANAETYFCVDMMMPYVLAKFSEVGSTHPENRLSVVSNP